MNLNLKSLLFFGIVCVLMISSFTLAVPQASAVNTSADAWNYYKHGKYVTDRYTPAKICGDHYCTADEFTQWKYGTSASHIMPHGKMIDSMHGENIMKKLGGSVTGNSTMHSK